MPKAEIMSANSGEGGTAAGPYTPAHERKNGPWDEYEMDDAGRTVERADQIRGNPKMMEAMAAHHKKKAKHHRKMAESMRGPMKRGLVSEKAFEKASKSRG